MLERGSGEGSTGAILRGEFLGTIRANHNPKGPKDTIPKQ